MVASAEKHLTELHIGGIFPMEAGSGGWPGGQACLPAVQMALDDINQNEEILSGYRLVLHHYNSKCQPGLAAQQMYELLYKKPVKLMLLAGCSPVTTVVAEAAPVWNLVVLSYGASSPALSNRYRFPTLFRTHPSANMQNPTRIKLFEKFRWRRITILQSVEEVFVSTARDLEEQCRERGIRVERQSFYGDPTDAVKALVRQDARIIVGLFYVTEARRVLCQAYKHGLYGRKYVWFFIGWYADTWYIPPKDEFINCTAKQMEEAAQYHFTTESIMLSRDKNPAISGMTGLQFQSRLTEMIDTDPANTGGFPEAPLAYDAIWALALAFNCTMSSLPENSYLEEFTYNDTIIANRLFECVKNTQFKGVSGQVMFSDSGDRIARTQIEQMQDGKYVVLGYYDTTSQRLDWIDKELFFGKGPPPDATIIKESLLTVSKHLYIGVFILVVIGLVLAIASFAFNVYYLGRSIVRESQPQCNNVLIAGCALCSLSLVLMGLPAEGVTFPRQSFSLLCHSRISILMVGFTFAYGSMFAKVWIVHRMGANENHELASYQKDEEEGSPWESIRLLITAMVGRQALVAAALRKFSTHAYGSIIARRSYILNQPIPACKFYIVIACLFVLDVVIILSWIVFDPLQREEQRFHLQDPSDADDDVMLLPILELCQSKHQEVWIGLILGEKCLLLVFGLFLAYESRKFKLKYVNDSRLVGVAIYNVAILSLVTGPIVTLLIRSQADANFAFVSFTVLLCTYMSLGLVFVPKMLHVYRVPYVKDDNAAAVGQHLLTTLTPSEQKRYDQLMVENTDLKRQIDLKERKISECRQQLEKRLKDVNLMNGYGEFVNNNNSSRISEDENPTYSSPTTLTTTALIEVQPTETGQESDFDEDSSSCSNEILL